jgi:hypothetical protein
LLIAGTNTIGSFGTTYAGAKFVRFSGALTITHSASLVLPGAADITTVAGDTCVATPIGAPAVGWRISDYRRMAKPLVEDDALRLAAAAATYLTQANAAATYLTPAAASSSFAVKGANTDITSLASPALGAATATTQGGTSNGTLVATTGMVQAALMQSGKVLKVQCYTDAGSTTTAGSPANMNVSSFGYTPVSINSTLIISVTGNMTFPALGTGAGSMATCIGSWNGSAWVPGSTAALVLGEEFGTTYTEHTVSPFAIQYPFGNTALTVRQFDVMGWTFNAAVPLTVGQITCVITEVQN